MKISTALYICTFILFLCLTVNGTSFAEIKAACEAQNTYTTQDCIIMATH